GEREGQHYFTMELVEGRTLAELVRDQPLAARRAAELMRLIAGAMHHAHQQGVLHRDLKPSNILVDATEQPRITDFGLARQLHGHGEATLTVTHQALGSPSYVAPEQARGSRGGTIGPAADLYALGAVL